MLRSCCPACCCCFLAIRLLKVLAFPCLQLKQPAYAFEVGNKVAALNVLMQEVRSCISIQFGACGCSVAAVEVGRAVSQELTHPSAAQIDPSNAGRYFDNARAFFDQYLNRQIPHTPNGLAYPYHFGALRPTTQVLPHPVQQPVTAAYPLLHRAVYEAAAHSS
jgi:hypothetical protein